MELLQTYFVVALGILAGLFVFYCFAQVIAHTAGAQHTDDNIRQDEEIDALCDDLRFQRIHLLNNLGSPEDNGRWSSRQCVIWEQIDALKCEEEKILKQTEVVNLEPLGHNIGRIWRKQ